MLMYNGLQLTLEADSLSLTRDTPPRITETRKAGEGDSSLSRRRVGGGHAPTRTLPSARVQLVCTSYGQKLRLVSVSTPACKTNAVSSTPVLLAQLPQEKKQEESIGSLT